jgi:endonuclease G, mitochondrial
MRSGNNGALPTIFAALLVLSATQSNPPSPPHTRAAVFTRYEKSTAQEAFQKQIEGNCKFGLPEHKPRAPIGPTRLIFRDGYVLEHSSELRIPLWVCERVTRADLQGRVNKRLDPEPFAPDPNLARWPHAELKDYSRSGYARGHMAPDADRTKREEEKAETYYLSNMVPQAGQRFNSSVWLQLEKKVRGWACKRGECWVVTGVLLHDPKEETAQSADGVVQFYTIGQSPVAIPTHLFKIVLAKPAPNSAAFEALAFVFKNESYDPGTPLEDFLCSIEFIQDRAGFNFFPNMPVNLAKAILRKEPDVLWESSDECTKRKN